jgi:CRISPR-associated protein Csd1
MILQSLYNYYQILLKDPEIDIARPGYSSVNVNFALNLSSAGELTDLIPFSTKYFDGYKERERPYRRMVVPEQVKRTVGIAANFLWDNAVYVLGISDKNAKDKDYSQKRFEEFKKINIEILSHTRNEAAQAVVFFLQNHQPEKARDHPVIQRHLEDLLKGGNLIFYVNGKNVLEEREILNLWEERLDSQEAVKMQCLVTGEIAPIARLHPNIQGVNDANPTGASLVGFNDRAYESYNRVKEQGLNSPVSRRAASGYGVALNFLLSNQNPNPKIHLGDTTVVCWAENENKGYAQTISILLNPQFMDINEADQDIRREAEKFLNTTGRKVAKGHALDVTGLKKGLDENTRFFVLGLAPNAARLSVRFFISEPFGVFVERIMNHYAGLELVKEFSNQPDYISPYQIISECVSPNVNQRDKELKSSWSLMGGALLRSILTGAPYPEGLYTAILNRIRHDQDEGKSRKINYTRAAYIKAHLIRKYRRQPLNPYQEALQMTLNKSFKHPAYVLGRLFAVLEKAQQEAIGNNVNATIKDRYFASACATPASVFPTLLRLSHHHTAKAEYGSYLDRRIQDLLDLLEAGYFPARFNLDEQGLFILGYYHQRADFFAKDTKNPVEIEDEKQMIDKESI